MLINKQYYKELHKKLNLNGFIWIYFDSGIYAFQREEKPRGYALIECSEEDIDNGNLEWMCANGYTTGKEEQKRIKAKYKRQQLKKVS